MKSARWLGFVALLGVSITLASSSPAWSQGGTQRQTKLVLPKVQSADVQPELVALPQMGAEAPLDGACFSADGRTLAAWSAGRALIWDIATRQVRCAIDRPWGSRELDGAVGGPAGGLLALSPEGSRLATASDGDYLVRVWDTRDARVVRTIRPGGGVGPARLAAESIAWSLDGAVLAAVVGGARNLPLAPGNAPPAPLTLEVWDSATGAEVAACGLPADDSKARGPVVAFLADGGLVVALQMSIGPGSGAEAPLRVVSSGEWAPGLQLDVLDYNGGDRSLVASPDGRLLTLVWQGRDGGPDGPIASWLGVWDVTKQASVVSFPADAARFASERALGAMAAARLQVTGVVSSSGPRISLRIAGAAAGYGDREIVDLATGQSVALSSPGVLSADGALAVSGDGVVDVATGSRLFTVACRGAGELRFEDRGRRLVWCDDRGKATTSWLVDGATGGSASVPRVDDTLAYRDPNVSAWSGPEGLRVIVRSSGEETLLPEGSVACSEVLRMLTEGRDAGLPMERLPRNDGRTVLARRPDGTVVVAALAPWQSSDSEFLSVAYARADGTVQNAPPMDLVAALGGGAMASGLNRSDTRLALNPGGERVAWCFGSGYNETEKWAAVWDLSSGTKLWAAPTPSGWLGPPGKPWFTPSGDALVVAGGLVHASVLDSQTGEAQSVIGTTLLEAATADFAWWVGCVPVVDLQSSGPGGDYLSLCRAADGATMALPSVAPWPDHLVPVDLSPDGRRLAAQYAGGLSRLWDLPPGGPEGQDPTLVATFVHDATSGAGACAVPAGYVWSTPGAERLLGWRLGDQIYPFEQFAERYERPDLVRRALAGEDISGEKGLTGDMIPPTAAFLAPEYEAKVAGGTVKVEIEVAGVRPLKRVDLLIDGRPVADEIVAAAKEETIEPNHVVISLDLPMPAYARRVRLQAYAYDEEMLRSKAAEVTFVREGATPPATVVHVLSVGVTKYRNEAWNTLKFADADAVSFASLAGEGVQRKLLVNENATSSNVKFALDQMRASVTEDDVAAIFLAGHGILGLNGDYYFLLHDSDEKDLANTALKWDDFVAALKALRAKLVLVFADTCHSGSLTGSESIDTLINRLNKKAGVVVFTASRGDEASIEREDWGHGAFTKALLEGFAGQADTYPKDRLVSLAELKEYVIPRVGELTGNRQHPFLPRVEDFDPAQAIAAVTAEVK